jgi:hypothetical protein
VKPEGSYRLEHLSPGDYRVYFLTDPADEAPAARETVSLREGEEVRAPDLVVGR